MPAPSGPEAQAELSWSKKAVSQLRSSLITFRAGPPAISLHDQTRTARAAGQSSWTCSALKPFQDCCTIREGANCHLHVQRVD
jgi:hypothetical protein